jgi:hypothetical protein
VLQKKIETLNGHIAKWIKAKEKEKKGGFWCNKLCEVDCLKNWLKRLLGYYYWHLKFIVLLFKPD